jgi:hypothetical protein
MAFEKGQSGNPAGRPKGAVNKLTADLRDAIIDAFGQVGGAEYLVEQARANPQAFMALLGKVIPKDVTVGGSGEAVVVQVVTGVPRKATDAG